MIYKATEYICYIKSITMNNIQERISALRKYMERESLSAFIVPSGDNHFGEYYQDHYACRRWISGFTGSAGTFVVTNNKAALWTDSRYFVQAEKELSGSEIILMKMKSEGTPSISDWLKTECSVTGRVGADGALISKSDAESLRRSLNPLELILTGDPFEIIWKDRPVLKFNKVISLSTDITGESIDSKIKRVVSHFPDKQKCAYVVTSCDDIAWLFNLRGSDIPYNPLFAAYTVIRDSSSFLFVNKGVIDKDMGKELGESGVEILDYNTLGDFLASFDSSYTIMAPDEKISELVYRKSISGGAGFVTDNTKGGIISMLKSVKNETEIDGFRRAMLYDAVAWVRFIMYLESELENNPDALSEFSLSQKIAQIRAAGSEFYKGESFYPIVAYEANGALPHYSPSKEHDVKIQNRGMLLVDTGAQYICGTTDTTRTFSLGEPDELQKRDYTMVLKGMIDLSRAVFPKGTRGSSLDILARGPLCNTGRLYMHGTGHGVGHYLCVHEGPQSIRMEENPVEIQPGMVTSNEPAVYITGSYGIRIENLILCREYEGNQYGTFYNFETLTMVPVDKKAIEFSLLNKEQLMWLNDYHEMVYKKISPLLNNEERVWLKARTSRIS